MSISENEIVIENSEKLQMKRRRLFCELLTFFTLESSQLCQGEDNYSISNTCSSVIFAILQVRQTRCHMTYYPNGLFIFKGFHFTNLSKTTDFKGFKLSMFSKSHMAFTMYIKSF